MKRLFFLVLLTTMTILFMIFNSRPLYSASPGREQGDRLSPYFLVEGDIALEHFPLLETSAEVNIAGITAEVTLTQTYKNDGKKTIEAVYVFPLGTKSAIHAMTMKIGDRVVEAQIEEKYKAQKIYQNAKDQGQVASLLEQERPNVFQMRVANIMPGDVIEVIVKYTEILVPEDGTYEFVFPTVVGPRFTGEKDKEVLKGEDNWTVTPYLHEGEEPPYEFDIKVNIRTGIDLAKVWVTSHKTNIEKKGKDGATITLKKVKGNSGNRDFIVRYTLQGNAIHSGLLLYPGEEENYFLLMLEPPENVKINMVSPREYVFIIDVSGSMHGFPLEVSKALIKGIITDLRPQDYFNILFFSGGSDVLSEHPLKATSANKKKAIAMVMQQSGGGGTMILDAFKRALALKKQKGLSRILITATDGYVAVEKEVFDLIQENLDQANFFAFGIGTGVNRYIIDGIARVGRGEPFVVTSENEAEATAEKFMDYIAHPLLTDIKVSFNGFDAYDIEPIAMPDLFAKRPLVLFGKYKTPSGSIKVTGNTPAGPFKKVLKVTASLEDTMNGALGYLWARERIARLADYAMVGEDVQKEVINLGLKYHLMTEYTSFVAVDKIVRKTGEVVTVKQPLPLPQGVTDYALDRRVMGAAKAAPSAPYEMAVDGNSDFTRNVAPQLYVAGGIVPPNITLAEVEDALLSQLKDKLETIFKKWELESITVKLTVHNGRIMKLQILQSESKKIDNAKLLEIFKTLVLPGSVQGSIEVQLEYS